MNKNIVMTTVCVSLLATTSGAVAGWREGVKAYDDGNYQLALREFSPLVKSSDAKYILYYLGTMYEEGLGVDKDMQKAMAFYVNSVKAGDERSAVKIGAMYYNGNGFAQDYAEALKWFGYAADKGNPTASYNMALMYLDGSGVPQDFSTAFAYMKTAANNGDMSAQKEVGRMYYEGKGTPQDYTGAVRYLMMASNQGDSEAQLLLGDLLSNSSLKGAPINLVHAHKWYNIAAAYSTGALHNEGVNRRDALILKMKPLEVQEAQKLAAAWKPQITEKIYFENDARKKPVLGMANDDTKQIVAKKAPATTAKKEEKMEKLDAMVEEGVNKWQDIKTSVTDWWEGNDSGKKASDSVQNPKAQSKTKKEAENIKQEADASKKAKTDKTEPTEKPKAENEEEIYAPSKPKPMSPDEKIIKSILEDDDDILILNKK